MSPRVYSVWSLEQLAHTSCINKLSESWSLDFEGFPSGIPVVMVIECFRPTIVQTIKKVRGALFLWAFQQSHRLFLLALGSKTSYYHHHRSRSGNLPSARRME